METLSSSSLRCIQDSPPLTCPAMEPTSLASQVHAYPPSISAGAVLSNSLIPAPSGIRVPAPTLPLIQSLPTRWHD